MQVIFISELDITLHLAPSLKATVTKATSIGKPDPVIVSVVPPMGLILAGLTEETTSGMATGVVPEATEIKPWLVRTSTLSEPALGALDKVH